MTKLYRYLCLLALAGSCCLGARAQNVGIGTTTPTQTLDVNGALRVRGLSGSGARLPQVQPDGTLGLFSSPYSSATDPYAAQPVLLNPNPAGSTSGGTSTGNGPYSVAVSGTLAYVVNRGSNSLQVFDVSQSTSPVLRGLVSTGSRPQGVAVSGSTAYIVNTNSNTLQLFQVSSLRAVGLGADGSLTLTNPPTLSVNDQSLSISGGNTVTLPGDDLGNHTATQALQLGANALLGTGDDLGNAVGLGIRADGGLNLGQNTYHNLFVGYQAGQATTPASSNEIGSNNLFVGYQSGYRNTTGGGNQFSGYQSGYNNTTGMYNQFSGFKSGSSNTTGGGNQFNGYGSGYRNTTGNDNLFSGFFSGYSNTTGSNNVFSGERSGYNNTTGSTNTAVGYGSGPASGNLTNTLALGATATVSTDNTIQLGNATITSLRCQVGLSVSSDARFKYDVRPNVPGLAFITQLRPVTYRFDTGKLAAFQATGALPVGFTPNAAAPVQTGFLAQEVAAVAQRLGYRFDGVHAPATARDHYSLAYAQFVVPLVRAVQEQQAQIEALQAQNAALHAQATQAQADHAALLSLQQEVARLREALVPVAQASR